MGLRNSGHLRLLCKPFRASLPVVPDYNMLGAHLGPRISNFASGIPICTIAIPSGTPQ